MRCAREKRRLERQVARCAHVLLPIMMIISGGLKRFKTMVEALVCRLAEEIRKEGEEGGGSGGKEKGESGCEKEKETWWYVCMWQDGK